MTSSQSDSSKYLVNARWSLGIAKKKMFFVFLVGRNKRLENLSAANERRQNESFGKALIYTGLLVWVLAGFLVLSFTALYLAKSYAGIDLVKGKSPFPSFLKQIGVCH
jgi:hypothetical protein